MSRLEMLHKMGTVVSEDFMTPFHITYLNFYSYQRIEEKQDLHYLTKVGADGISLCWLHNVFNWRRPISRSSFDFTSNARDFLNLANKTGMNVVFIGGTEKESSKFQHLISKGYDQLNRSAFFSGFPLEAGFKDWDSYLDYMMANGRYDVAVLSLGTPLQEKIALKIIARSPNISTVTSGGFIAQCAQGSRLNYYPKIIDKFELRWLYRFAREKHVFWRTLKWYVPGAIRVTLDFLKKSSRC